PVRVRGRAGAGRRRRPRGRRARAGRRAGGGPRPDRRVDRLACDAMRLVIARCSVDYVGRLTAHLPEAVRLLMVKADGCVAVHAAGGAYKPPNWRNAPNTLAARARGCPVTAHTGGGPEVPAH